MNTDIFKPIGWFLSIILFISCGPTNEHKLFDGKSLEGWEGSETFFGVENEAIVWGVV